MKMQISPPSIPEYTLRCIIIQKETMREPDEIRAWELKKIVACTGQEILTFHS